MIARLIKTARSLQILQKIGQIPSHKRSTLISIRGLSCKNVLIGLTLTCDVSREKWWNVADRGLGCKENRSIPIEWSIKCGNEKQQIRTHSFSLRDVMIAQWAGGALSKVLYEEGPPIFPPPHPPYPFTYNFWQKRYPFRIPSIDKWHPLYLP